jgi:hypothetical protein
MDNVDEQIDVVTRSVLALTVTCARCHDHKFDPIPTIDYYALAGIFTSTDNCAGVRNKMGGGGLDYYDPSMLVKLAGEPPPVATDKLEKVKAELDEAKKAWDAIRGTPEGLKLAADGFPTQRPYRLKFEKIQAEYAALTDPVARGFAVHGVREAKKIADTEVRIRGEAEKVGPIVPRGFLSTFDVPGAAKIDSAHSGRLELANWLTSTKNPLTPRVAVNRIWQHLFGQGLVSTVDNFGVMGAAPTQPELLDYLANRFIENGWSTKKLIRAIVLTRAYQLASSADAGAQAVDPSNQLIWRHGPRRLDAEEMRDAMLLAAGNLNFKRPTGSPAQSLKMVEMTDNGQESRMINEKADGDRHRSIYLPLLRGLTPHDLEAFDPVDQTLVTGNRDATTVSGQALFLLNSSFVRREALLLAERLLKEKEASEPDRIQTVYRLALGRSPTEKEIERARSFLAEYESDYLAQEATNPTPKPVAPKKPIEPKKPREVPANPDEIDQTGEPIVEAIVQPKDAKTAAWLAFTQALFGSAEFRYVR